MKKLLVLTILMLLIVACESPSPVEVVDTPIVEEPTIEAPTTIPVTVAPIATPKPATATARPSLELSNLGLELIVMEKQCFGSAGCTITVRPVLGLYDVGQITDGEYHTGPPPFETTYTLIYEIYGGEDGTLTFNLTINLDGTYSYREARISTAHQSDELTVEAVRLMEDL